MASTQSTDETSASKAGSLKESLGELSAIDFDTIETSLQARSKAVALCHNILRSIEDPDQVAMRWAYEVASQRMCVRMGVELNIFDHLWRKENLVHSSAELAQRCNCEESLLVRIMRGLTLLGFVAEEGPRLYKATRFTESFAKPHIAATTVICHDYTGATQARAHEYFQQEGFHNPVSLDKAPFQRVFNTDKKYFDYIYATPGMAEVFARMMEGVSKAAKPWSDWFPVQEQILLDAEDSDGPVLVDVGGGNGRDLCAFLKSYPSTKGRLMLQDLQEVVQGLSFDGINCMSYDFFQPQPIKGARVYYMNFILHDWPDSQAVLILQNIRSAMTLGYSKLLLNENVVPETDVPARLVAMDLSMMCLFGGKERTEEEFSELLARAGLKLAKVWHSYPVENTKRIIEAVLV